MSDKRQKIIKVDLLATNERCYETYSEAYDYMLQEIQRDIDLKFAICKVNSTYDKTMPHWMIDQDPGDDVNIEIPDPIKGTPGLAWIAFTQGTKKDREKHKAQIIKKWTAEALEKDKRVLASTPFLNVLCPACAKPMKYDWTIMYDRGTLEEPDEHVLHTYVCDDECQQREAIFEDGIRWVTNSGSRCFFCQSVRTTTVTKDHSNNIFLIHRCLRCKRTQVEEKN